MGTCGNPLSSSDPYAWPPFSQGRPCRHALSQVWVSPAHPGLCTPAVAVVRGARVRRTWRCAGWRDRGWWLCTWASCSISPSVSWPEAAQLAAVLAPRGSSALRPGWRWRATHEEGLCWAEPGWCGEGVLESRAPNLCISPLPSLYTLISPGTPAPFQQREAGRKLHGSQGAAGCKCIHLSDCAVQHRRCQPPFITYLDRRFPRYQTSAVPTHRNQQDLLRLTGGQGSFLHLY